jgi:hypothetical protein
MGKLGEEFVIILDTDKIFTFEEAAALQETGEADVV